MEKLLGRDAAIDFCKGVCVSAMIYHHAINYYPQSFLLIKGVRFVSGAFVFLTGFLVTYHYLRSYDLNTNRIYYRLIWRAVKLLIIYALINIGLSRSGIS